MLDHLISSAFSGDVITTVLFLGIDAERMPFISRPVSGESTPKTIRFGETADSTKFPCAPKDGIEITLNLNLECSSKYAFVLRLVPGGTNERIKIKQS